MGAMRLRPKAVQDLWQRQATAAAIESARKMIDSGVVHPDASVGGLSDEQLGWILCAGICSWIATRAAQAVDEDTAAIEVNIRDTGTVPLPWDAGAVETILGDLANVEGIDWNVRVFVLLRQRRRFALLRTRPDRPLSSRGLLCRSHFAGRDAERSPCAVSDKI